MKKWTLLLLVLAIPVVTMAGWFWTQDQDISNYIGLDDNMTINTANGIALPQFNPNPKHAAWAEGWRDGAGYHLDMIYRQRSSSGWGQKINLTNSLTVAKTCYSIASDPSGNYLYVVFDDQRDYPGSPPIYQTYFVRSTNGGATWETPYRLSWYGAHYCDYATVAASSNGKVFVVFRNTHWGGVGAITFARSDNYGASGTWAFTDYISSSDGCYRPTIAANLTGNYVHVAWTDNNYTGYPSWAELSYRRYTISSGQWDPIVRLTTKNPHELSDNAHIACANDGGSNVHIVWQDFRERSTGLSEVYYKRSTDNGATWPAPEYRLSGGISSFTRGPTISTGFGSSLVVDLVYLEEPNGPSGSYQTDWRRSLDGGSTWGAITQLTTQGNNYGGSVATDQNNCADIVFGSTRDNDYEIYYKRYFCSPCAPTTPGGVEDFNLHVDLMKTNDPKGGIQVAPNPVRDETRISLALTGKGISGGPVKIYDTQGRFVRSLTLDRADSRDAFTMWDGKDAAGKAVSNGVYLVAVQHGGRSEVGRLVVAR